MSDPTSAPSGNDTSFARGLTTGTTILNVAGNPRTPPTVLDVLANFPHSWVRAAVAGNPSTRDRCLDTLACDSDVSVRRAVAANPATQNGLIEEIVAAHVSDEDAEAWEVRHAAASNPNSPSRLLQQLGEDPHLKVRLAVARHADPPPGVLRRLRRDDDRRVRATVAANPNTPGDVLSKMFHDSIGGDAADFKMCSLLAANTSTGPILFTALIAAFDEFRSVVADNVACPPDMLAGLAEPAMRSFSANDPSLGF